MIKTRQHKNECTCDICGTHSSKSLMMFDIKIKNVGLITLCDMCNSKLFKATLNNDYKVMTKTKDKKDVNIINERQNKLHSLRR